MREKRVIITFVSLFVAVLLIAMQGVWAAPGFSYVISNSENWKDVYSSMLYANLQNTPSDFLVSTGHGQLLLNGIMKDNTIRVITSKKQPYVFNYPDQIRAEQYKGVDELQVNDANLELIEQLPDINNFIIVGSAYGYNGIAVASYAVVSKSWVFFADRTNIAEIDSILARRNVQKIILYGEVDREVTNTVLKYKPTIINNADRFKDNVDIVKKYIEIRPSEQVLLTNGEFIEKQIVSGSDPVLFTGKENVPDQISEYLKKSSFQVGVLVGSDLVGAATNIRRSTGISVIVKFARGARSPASGAIAQVEGLDLFYIPAPIMKLELSSVKYNRASSQLEVTYKSTSNTPIYFKGTITTQSTEDDRKRVGDTEPIFIAPNDFKTMVYQGVSFNNPDNASADIFTLYGETTTSLEKILEAHAIVSIVNVIDSCQIDITKVTYSKSKKEFLIRVKNIGAVTCWVNTELIDVIIANQKETLGSVGAIEIPKGSSRTIVIEKELLDEDLEKNKVVDLAAYYGEREDSLVKILRGKFDLGIELISTFVIILIVISLLILILLFIILFVKRRRNKEEEY